MKNLTSTAFRTSGQHTNKRRPALPVATIRLFFSICTDIRLKGSDEAGDVTRYGLPDIIQVDFAVGMDEHIPHPGHRTPRN